MTPKVMRGRLRNGWAQARLDFLWREENQLESWPMLLEMVIKLGAAIPERLGNAE